MARTVHDALETRLAPAVEPPDRTAGAVALQRALGNRGTAAVARSLARTPEDGGDRGARRIPAPLLAQLERSFGARLGDVRIDDGEAAVRETSRTRSRAIAEGERIMFAPGQYRPDSVEGQQLLAHELAHVVQQRRGALNSALAGPAPAQARVQLEAEAERAGAAFAAARPVPPITGAAGVEPQHSLGMWDVLTAAASGIERVADLVAEELMRLGDATIGALVRLRRQLASRTELAIAPEVAAELEAIYRRFAAAAPSWLPVPSLSFAGPPAQHAGPIAIPVGVILLLIAFLIVFWWVATGANPTIRRQRERDIQRVIDVIRDALNPPATPVPVPVPVAGPQETPAPVRAEPVPRPVSVPVPRVGTRYRNQRCTDERLDELHGPLHRLCDQGFSCSDTAERDFLGLTTRKAYARAIAAGQGFSRDEILRRIALAQACRNQRRRIQDECFTPDPSDPDWVNHEQQIRDVEEAIRTCLAKLAARGMAPP